MPEHLTGPRNDAVMIALRQLVAACDGSENRAAKELHMAQTTVNAALKRGRVGLKLADRVADHYGTTLDGLVRKFVGTQGPVRAGDVIGWREAVEEARRRHPRLLEDWTWHRAADIQLPVAPDLATPEFAYDLALLLAKHSEVSSVVRRAK